MTVIGVDFGTTNSVVSVLGPDGTVDTVRHPIGAAELEHFRGHVDTGRRGRDLLDDL